MMGPLSELRVLDLAWVVAGPLIGRTLADFGATVIRVESAKRIETARLIGPFPDGRTDPQKSLLFENCNANKLGLVLNLADACARAVVLDLVRWADVVTESFAPGQMDKFGLSYDVLRAINPGIIMISTSLMGQSGPHAAFAGFGNMGAAMAGYQLLVGNRDEEPIGPFGPYTDFVGPRFSLFALLAALDHRDRTGAGCFLDVSQAEAGIQFLAPQIAAHSVDGRLPQADGNRDIAMAPNGVFRTGDGKWIAITVRSDEEWVRFATVVNAADLTANPLFADLAGRKAHEDGIEATVADWAASRAASAIEFLLQAQDIPAHIVVDSADFLADPHLDARGHFVRLPHPLMGETLFEAARFNLSDTPATYRRSAPTFGRDRDHVLQHVLRYDKDRIAELVAADIFV